MTIATIGGEFQVNTETANGQNSPAITYLSGGGFVVTWTDTSGTLGDYDTSIKAQIFDPGGNKVGSEFLVNENTYFDQGMPTITALTNGGFVVTWYNPNYGYGPGTDYDGSISAQIYDAAGAKIGNEFIVNTNTGGTQYLPGVTALADGQFAITWTDGGSGTLGDSSGNSIKAKIFDADGNVMQDEFLVNTVTADSQSGSTIATLADGGFVITWNDDSQTLGDTSFYSIKAQVFNADGSMRGVEFLVNTSKPGSQNAPVVSGLAGGGFVVTWYDYSGLLGDNSQSSIKAQVFGANGAKVGGEILVNTNTDGSQFIPTVAGLSDGGFVVTWTDGSQTLGDTNGNSIKAQVFTATGAKAGSEFLVNTTTALDQQVSAVTAAPGGGFIVSWVDYSFESSPGAYPTAVIKAQMYGAGDLRISSDGGGGTASVLTPENGTAVTTVKASYIPIGATVTYAITGGADAALFAIDAQTGALTFKHAPNFEIPGDAGANGIYDVTVSATDGTVTDTQQIAVTVTDAKEPPSPISKLGGEFVVNTQTSAGQSEASVAQLANGGFVVTWQDSSGTLGDSSGTSIKAQIYGADGAKVGAEFRVNTATVSSQMQPMATGLKDGGFVVTWQDYSRTGLDTSGIAIKAQVFDAGGAKVGGEFLVNTATQDDQSYQETTALANGGFVVTWMDYSTSPSSGRIATIKAQVFDATGAKIGSEFKANTDTTDSHLYPVTTGLAGGGFALSWIQKYYSSTAGWVIHIEVQTYAADGTPAGAAAQIMPAAQHDFDQPSIAALAGGGFVVTWIKGNTAATNGYADITGQIFAADGTKLGGEFLVNTELAGEQWTPRVTGLPNGGFVVTWYDNGTGLNGPGDANIKAQVFDASGHKQGDEFLVNTQTADIQADAMIAGFGNGGFVVTWTDVNPAGDGSEQSVKAQIYSAATTNAAPVIDSNGGGATAAVTIPENTKAVTTVHAADADAGTTVTYAIGGGADAALFTIDASTGALAFVNKPNFEAPGDVGADNVYNVTVTASDGTLTDSQQLEVTVSNVNEPPVITSNGGGDLASLSVAENGTSITTVVASDPELDSIAYAIAGGTDRLRFNIDQATGALSFKAAPNFESPSDSNGDNVYSVQVSATDTAGNTTFQTLSVTVTNVNEAPAITSNGAAATASISISENTTAVTKVTATDPDAGATQTYSISGGVDAGKFQIDATTGALSFKSAPNFEAPTDAGGDNVYDVIVKASDGTLFDTQAIAVTVTNVNEAPVITNNGGSPTGAVSMAENGTSVTTVQASDPDAGTTLTYSISGGADAGKFDIDSATGALTFKAAPNFEAPTDAGGNNVYDVIVKASDGTLFDTQALAVTVTNVNEAPVITSNGGGDAVSFIVDEKVAAIATIAAGDPDGGAAPTYSLGGVDADLFNINAATGQLTFKARPNVETPGDSGGDNVYDVIVRASDAGGLSDTQALTIEVRRFIYGTALTDSGTKAVAGTAANDYIFGLAGNDVITALDGNDMIDGGAGNDRIAGGKGNDTYVVDSTADVVTELANEGTDTVLSSASTHILGANVENLTFTNAVTHKGIGNDLANTITGNDGADSLAGKGGNDTLLGLGGNDTLAGDAGNDVFDGGAGADKMVGGEGDDVYFVDNAGDKVVEDFRKGNDTVNASVTYRISNQVETLNLTGSAAINGTGGTTANTLRGNVAANVLSGGAGDDVLSGGLGNDTLIGGKGADKFLFDSAPGAANIDVVRDFLRADGDKLVLSKAVFADLGALGALTTGAYFASATATAAHDADDRIVYNTATGQLWYDADGLGGQAEVQIATIGTTTHPGLTFADFLVVA